MDLIAGPWVGEFGWELFHWQGYIRALSKEFDTVVCIGQPDHDPLYEDFCNQYINYESVGNRDMWFCQGYDNQFQLTVGLTLSGRKYLPVYPNIFWVKPNEFREVLDIGPFKDIAPTYIKYGSPKNIESEYIVFHGRNRQHRNDQNWSNENWNVLAKEVSKKYKVISIGTSQEAYCSDDSEDRRDIPLKETLDLLHNAKAIVGPSSGPMHLATLCGCPQVVWSGVAYNRKKYLTQFNPFKVRVNYFDEMGWQPSPDLVLNKMSEFGL